MPFKHFLKAFAKAFQMPLEAFRRLSKRPLGLYFCFLKAFQNTMGGLKGFDVDLMSSGSLQAEFMLRWLAIEGILGSPGNSQMEDQDDQWTLKHAVGVPASSSTSPWFSWPCWLFPGLPGIPSSHLKTSSS